MNKYYGYIRVSTETQADKGYGLETQENAILKYCEDNNLELLDTFRDEGISGALGDKDDLTNRQGITDLLNTLEEGDKVIVMNTSRLWRDDGARVTISRIARKLKCEIISIEQTRYSLYSTDPQEFLFNSIMEVLDQYDRMCINVKLSKGRNTKASNGTKPCGRLPYGYEYAKDKSVVVNSNEAEVVKEIFKLAAYNKGHQDIATILNDKNIKTRTGKQWSRQTISVMLDNDFYIGILTHIKKTEGLHSPIIDMTTWDRIH